MATRVFSSGMLVQGQSNTDARSISFFLTVLNNNEQRSTNVIVRIFQGVSGPPSPKVFIDEKNFTVPPSHTKFETIANLENIGIYEIQVQLTNEVDDVLLWGVGVNVNDTFVDAHRFVHSEWTRIDKLTDVPSS